MPDNDGTGAPAAQDGQPPAGNGAPPPAGDEQDDPKDDTKGNPDDEPMTLAEAKKLRKEANDLRKKLTAAEQAGLSEQQKKDRELEELRTAAKAWESEKREFRLRESVTEAARRLNFANPTLAYRLIDRGSVTYDDDSGAPLNVESVLKDVLKTDPYLATPAGGGSWGAGARGNSTGDGNRDSGSDMNAMIRRAAGRT